MIQMKFKDLAIVFAIGCIVGFVVSRIGFTRPGDRYVISANGGVAFKMDKLTGETWCCYANGREWRKITNSN
jgi:hypothetical protein